MISEHAAVAAVLFETHFQEKINSFRWLEKPSIWRVRLALNCLNNKTEYFSRGKDGMAGGVKSDFMKIFWTIGTRKCILVVCKSSARVPGGCSHHKICTQG